ncbi:MAG: zinc-ribbon domain-containing protein [Elusimicrobia bacterium]|nr:zinc-ribbon domain-containing protein [Elusimicrobiota bacterium]
MDISCNSCSAKLVLPDVQVPKGVDSFKVKCPKCQGAIQVQVGKPAEGAPAQSAPKSYVPAGDTDFVEGRKLAMVCLDAVASRAAVQAALETMGCTVHVPASGEEAVLRLRRNRYELLIVHEAYGGAPDQNLVLKTLQPMGMALRRHICVGLVGKEVLTLDHMTAFAKSVNFVVAEKDLDKAGVIIRQAAADNDQFYRGFREALKEAGRV